MFCILGKPVPACDGNPLDGDPGVGFDVPLAPPRPTNPALGGPGTPQDFGIPSVSAGSSYNKNYNLSMK